MNDYTHYLICFENAGNGKKRRYFVLCKVLRLGTNGKPYLEVKSKNGKIVKRYAEPGKLIPVYEKI